MSLGAGAAALIPVAVPFFIFQRRIMNTAGAEEG
jgi:hypothetical protein